MAAKKTRSTGKPQAIKDEGLDQAQGGTFHFYDLLVSSVYDPKSRSQGESFTPPIGSDKGS